MDTWPSITNVLFMDIGCFQPWDKWLWHASLHTSTAISNESVPGRQTSELIDRYYVRIFQIVALGTPAGEAVAAVKGVSPGKTCWRVRETQGKCESSETGWVSALLSPLTTF